jgi:hypothetical protein
MRKAWISENIKQVPVIKAIIKITTDIMPTILQAATMTALRPVVFTVFLHQKK